MTLLTTLQAALQKADNPMQQLMFEWGKVAPYNALHIAELSMDVDLPEWQRELNSLVSTIPDPLLQVFQHPQVPMELATGDVVNWIQQELNRGFLPDELPLRSFVLPIAAGRCYFGICYSHWVADSVAIRLLMKHFILRLEKNSQLLDKINPPPKQFLPRVSLWRCAFSALKHMLSFKGVFRTPMSSILNYECGYVTTSLPTTLLPLLRRAAKQANASLNDVFTAALSAVLGEFWAERRAKFPDGKWRVGRNRIAIGTIADIRSPELKNTFGQFMGSYSVITENPERRARDHLLNEVAIQTQHHKATSRDIHSHREWKIALKYWQNETRPGKNAHFFLKNAPMMAGVSNVNLDACEHTQAIQAQSYCRVSPTGPLLPLVFTLTTYQGQLSLGVTYRQTAYSETDIHNIIGSFIAYLQGYVFMEERRDALVT